MEALVHEGGSSTPLIAHWPSGIDASQRNKLVHQPGHVINLMPTVVDVATAEYPAKFQSNTIEPIEGVSLAVATSPIQRVVVSMRVTTTRL